MARRPGRPPGTHGADTREQILAEAERQFSANGYAATTTRTIAGICRLTDAALYYHFGGKTALYEAVAEHVYPPMLTEFEAALVPARTFRERLRAVLETAIGLNRRRPALAGFVMGGPVEASRHPELRPVVDHHFSRLTALFDKLVEDARAAGELRAGVRTEALTGMVLAVLHGFAHLAFHGPSADYHDEVIRTFERLLDGELLAG
jgi:AcrR family transcriptional regulator